MTARQLVVLILLVLALVVSSLVLVRTSYDSRRLFTELDRARAEQRKLDVDYKRLDAEAQTQATHLRVEKVAREKLGMRTVSPAVTEPVVDTVITGTHLASSRAASPSAASPSVAKPVGTGPTVERGTAVAARTAP